VHPTSLQAKGEGRRARAYAWEMLVRLAMHSGSLVMRLPSHHLRPNNKQCGAAQPRMALLQQAYTRGRHIQYFLSLKLDATYKVCNFGRSASSSGSAGSLFDDTFKVASFFNRDIPLGSAERALLEASSVMSSVRRQVASGISRRRLFETSKMYRLGRLPIASGSSDSWLCLRSKKSALGRARDSGRARILLY
jgi:hypothetical protein